MLDFLKSKIHDFLRFTEKYTKTDMVYLASGGTWISIGNAISSLSSLLLVIAFGNLFPAEKYGVYQYVLSIASILATPTLSGINTALISSVVKGYEGTVIEGLKTKVRWGLLGGVASLLCALYYYLNQNNLLTVSFLITALFLPFMDSFTVYGSYWEGKKLFKQSTIYASLINIIRVAILIATLLFTQNVILVIFVYFISTTLLRLGVLLLTLKKIERKEAIDESAISYGKHLSAMRILGTVASQLDKILLFHSLGPVELAVYSFALTPVSKISNLLSPVSSLAMPKFAQTEPELLKETLPRKLFYFFILSSAIALLYILTAPYLYSLFLPAYSDSVIYSQVFALSLLFFPQKFLGTALTAHMQKKALYVITTISPIVKIISLFILLPLFGIWGAIAAMLLPLIINGILTIYYFRKM